MICPVCRQDTPLNNEGCFAMHRIKDSDRWTFCEFSGKPAEWAARGEAS